MVYPAGPSDILKSSVISPPRRVLDTAETAAAAAASNSVLYIMHGCVVCSGLWAGGATAENMSCCDFCLRVLIYRSSSDNTCSMLIFGGWM